MGSSISLLDPMCLDEVPLTIPLPAPALSHGQVSESLTVQTEHNYFYTASVNKGCLESSNDKD